MTFLARYDALANEDRTLLFCALHRHLHALGNVEPAEALARAHPLTVGRLSPAAGLRLPGVDQRLVLLDIRSGHRLDAASTEELPHPLGDIRAAKKSGQRISRNRRERGFGRGAISSSPSSVSSASSAICSRARRRRSARRQQTNIPGDFSTLEEIQ